MGIGLAGSWSGLAARFGTQLVAAQEQVIAKETPSSNGTPSSTTASILSVDQLVQELNAKAVQQVMQELKAKTLLGAWLHIHWTEVFDQDVPNNGVFPNGMAIPNQQINDTWYHVSDQGAVIESVSIMRTMDGKIVQMGVTSKGTSWNSATQEINSQLQLSIDQGLLDNNFLSNDLKWLEQFGNVATTGDLTLSNGDLGVEVVIGAKNDTPVKTEAYEKPSVGSETRAVFDLSTGYLLSREVIFWFVDGSQRMFSQLTQEITVAPPTDEVLDYLVQKDREAPK